MIKLIAASLASLVIAGSMTQASDGWPTNRKAPLRYNRERDN